MIERIARRYEGRWLQGYVRGKLRSDPIFAAAFELLKDSPLPVLNVGCGIGLLEFYLRERGCVVPLLGIDFDAKKIALAQRGAVHCRDLSFVVRDAVEPGNFSGSVVIVDVLHYLGAAAQLSVLENVAVQVAPGGTCLIRETPRDRSWRFRATQFEEFFLRASRWMKSGAVHYPSVEQVLAPFRARGFDCEARPLWGRTPFNSHLFILRAPASQTA